MTTRLAESFATVSPVIHSWLANHSPSPKPGEGCRLANRSSFQAGNLRLNRGAPVHLRGCAATADIFARFVSEDGAGNGIRTRDFDLGKVALYH